MASPLEQAIAGVSEDFQRARRAVELALGLSPFADDAPDGEGFRISEVFAVMHAAIASFADIVGGDQLPIEVTPGIALVRRATGVVVIVDGSLDGAARRRAIEGLTVTLRRADERLQPTAALVGLLVGLGARWAAAGFAPPIVLATLRRSAPRILELGRRVGADTARSDPQ